MKDFFEKNKYLFLKSFVVGLLIGILKNSIYHDEVGAIITKNKIIYQDLTTSEFWLEFIKNSIFIATIVLILTILFKLIFEIIKMVQAK
ncbi:hypothetical protein ETI06_13045 [Macrococcoides goetzii]|nr:hypothetical protein [Macrococcus goetzii]TDM39467.1 hypothetical protein ETI08_13495 [Macrococcus goetzii]TDM45172.1 hypothetical protein ETI06_13045 [Macrococcus goetzii]